MTLAGVAWGAYSLLGKAAGEPIATNARSFLWSVPLALGLAAEFPSEAEAAKFASGYGALMAVARKTKEGTDEGRLYEALKVASQLVSDAGFDPVVVGDLSRAKDFDYGTAVYVRSYSAREIRAELKLK